jgi:hypothetical protein
VLHTLGHASYDLKLVDLSGCSGTGVSSMKDILKYITDNCTGVMEIDVTK